MDSILNAYDYGFRIYNPGIGRFLSVDPLIQKYPELTPYQFASNTPIWAVDLDGREAYYIHGTSQSPKEAVESVGIKETLEYIMENVATPNHKSSAVDITFDWSKQALPLNESQFARSSAAKSLADHVISTHIEDEPITLIGYSHGGNVAAQAAPLISKALNVRVNLITISTPTSNVDAEFGTKEKLPNPKYNENPDNPNLKNAIMSWTHFYVPWDGVVALSGLYEGSGITYKSKLVNQVKVDPADIPKRNDPTTFYRHSSIYYKDAIKNAWLKSNLPRQMVPSRLSQKNK